MRTRQRVFEFLLEKQEVNGGYTGKDLTFLAEQLNVTPRGLRKRLSIWIQNDEDFSQFIYLGKEKPSMTLFEFFQIEQELTSNPIQVKKRIYEDIQEQRRSENQKSLAKSTYYRTLKQKVLSMYCSETDNWFKAKFIPFPEDYSIEKNRESLHKIFTFSDLITYRGADIRSIHQRLTKAKEFFSIYNVEPIRFYPEILSRNQFLKRLLSSIPTNQQLDAQKKLIFEIQASYIIECTDLLIGELIHKQGRIRQSNNASRQKVENLIRKDALESIRKKFYDLKDTDNNDIHELQEYSKALIDEEILARIVLFRRHASTYMSILEVLNDLTLNMTNGIKFQKNEAKLTYQLATKEITWNNLSEQKKRSVARKPDLVKAIDQGNMDIVPLLAINRIIEYIRNGKITFKESYYYQDIGERIKLIELNENEAYLTSETLDQFISETYPINGFQSLDSTVTEIEASDEEIPAIWTDLSDILNEVSLYIRSSNPTWFKEHQRLFKEQNDGLFSMEYTEIEFADRFYKSIGFMGRNFRYRDSEEFFSLKYFIQRYISNATLLLELKFLHQSIEQITNKKIECVVVDTMGVDARVKSILSTYHGRYHTIGFADLRAVSIDMTPIYSGVCRSTDSEAMNIVEVIDEVIKICGDGVRIYTGNGHTTTKISAGMAFLAHGVIAGGRLHYELKKNLEDSSIKKLKTNIELLNKVGKLLKEEPELGRVMAMRKHIYVDNLNVRKMVEDFGYLILKNVSKMGLPIDDICNVVERSNNLKKKTRIVEGTRTRVEPAEAELLLKSAELILCMVGLYHLLNGWNGHGSPINLADVRFIRPA
ncbi:MAG: hypothetical protein HF977_05120 [ANME-2 cluster archaeon]|nr:hypothetical protein [ANME-2 cluster archaeon]